MSDVPSETPPTATIVAAIDIGSNSLRMVIAEALPDGRIEILERVQRAVRLGQDTFRRGRLGKLSMRAAVVVLRDFRKMLDYSKQYYGRIASLLKQIKKQIQIK